MKGKWKRDGPPLPSLLNKQAGHKGRVKGKKVAVDSHPASTNADKHKVLGTMAYVGCNGSLVVFGENS